MSEQLWRQPTPLQGGQAPAQFRARGEQSTRRLVDTPHRGSDTQNMSSELMDAKIGKAKAEIDTEFAKLRADLQGLPGKGTIWGAAASIILGILAILAFGGDQFGMGANLADQRLEQLKRDEAQSEAIAQLATTATENNKKLDTLIERLDEKK